MSEAGSSRELFGITINSRVGAPQAFKTKGRRHRFATTAGITLGLLIIGLLSAAGGGAIVARNPTLFQILRWGGIAYLLYLAWEGWREAEWSEIFGLTLLYAGIVTAVHLLIVVFAGTFHRFLDDPKRSLWVRRILALALALTAIWIGWSTRTA